MDISPVAVAISRAKLASASTEDVLSLARKLLARIKQVDTPTGPFWRLAFHSSTLNDLCKIRKGLLQMRSCSDDAVLLRAAIMGCLHGPDTQSMSYLSNQMPRTFAPKPRYATDFWRTNRLTARKVSLLVALDRKLKLVERSSTSLIRGNITDVYTGDSSDPDAFAGLRKNVDLVITSPPYYGMRTYVQDQWLRAWFLGGPEQPSYEATGDLPSSSPEDFVNSLGDTWTNVASRARNMLHLYVRFGAIPSRQVDVRDLLLESLRSSDAPWKIVSVRKADTASAGRRQVLHMKNFSSAIEEIDLHAVTA